MTSIPYSCLVKKKYFPMLDDIWYVVPYQEHFMHSIIIMHTCTGMNQINWKKTMRVQHVPL